MSLFDVTKTSSQTDNRQAVDTEGQALQGGASAARDGSLVLGGTLNKNLLADDLSASNAVKATNSTVLGGAYNQNQLGGLKLNDNKGTITVNSSEGVEAVTKTFADTVKEFLNGPRPATAPGEGAPLEPPPADTGGGSDVLKPVMWVVGILLTILVGALLAARRKKKTA